MGLAIIGLLNEAFSLVEPDENAQALFTHWNDVSFEDEAEFQEWDMNKMLADTLSEHLGVEIDSETMKKGPEAVLEALRKAYPEFDEQAAPRKKTARQTAREALARKAEEQVQKGLRSLYLSLVKFLHPDLEADPQTREIKERTMKELTSAYEANDLHALLRIEAEWIASATDGLLTEDRLKAYITALGEQAKELEDELDMLEYSPRYAPIGDFIGLDAHEALEVVSKASKMLKRRSTFLADLVKLYSEPMVKKDFMQGIKEMVE